MMFRILYSSTILFFVPVAYAAAKIVPNCPVNGCRACDLVILGNNLITFLIGIGIFVAVISIAITAFQTIISGESGAHALGSTATNIVIGIIIMLAGWLIVDTLLKLLVAPGKLGPWNEIECIENPGIEEDPTVATKPGRIAYVAGGGKGSGAQCGAGNTACSPEALQALGMTPAQANTMSCIAMTESGGSPNAVNKNGGACGTFQILPSNWRNASLHKGSCNSDVSCNDATCNAQAAQSLMAGRIKAGKSAYGDWTCPGCNNKAQACVDKYNPGG